MRLTAFAVTGALGALWLTSCGGDDAALFSNAATNAAGMSQSAGGSVSGASGNSGGASFGGKGGSGVGKGGANNAGTENGGTSNNGGTNGNAGTENGGMSNSGGTNNNAGTENGGTNNDGGSPAGGAGGFTVAGNGGSGGSGGSGGMVNRPCKSDAACHDGQYCKKSDCSPEANGSCAQRPEVCPENDVQIVCGCDGHTYFGACLAATNGVNVQAQGVCDEANHLHCSGQDTCPNPNRKGLVCVDFEPYCGGQRDPECWILPDQCPDNDPNEILDCQNDMCVGLCEAAKSGKPFASGDTCN